MSVHDRTRHEWDELSERYPLGCFPDELGLAYRHEFLT